MTVVHVRRWLAGTAMLAIGSNAVAAFAYDDRFPHLFAALPAQVDQTEMASEPVPMPKRAPHKLKPKILPAPTEVSETQARGVTGELPPAAAQNQISNPLIAPVQSTAPDQLNIDKQFAAVASTLRVMGPTPPPQIGAAALSVPSPLNVAAQPEAYGKGPTSARVNSFNERFTFIVSVVPEQTSITNASREVMAAASDVPLPRPAPKRIRTFPVSGAALPFEPIAGDLSSMIEAKAKRHGVPLALAHAVVHVESKYNPKVTGKGGTHGLMQIKHATARGMGYEGTVKELYDPETNLEWGMRYLGGAHKLAKGDVCGTVMRYQGGHRTVRMSAIATKYCSKVHALLARRAPASPTAVARARPTDSAPVAQISLPAPPAPTRAALAFY